MTDLAFAYLAAGLGAAGSMIGGAMGIARLTSAAMEGAARQPEATGDIRGMMILTAAMIEGALLFALVICFLMGTK